MLTLKDDTDQVREGLQYGVLGQAMEPVIPSFRNPERPVQDWAATGAAG